MTVLYSYAELIRELIGPSGFHAKAEREVGQPHRVPE